MREGKEKEIAHRPGEPPALSLNRAARDPGRVVLRRAESPACPAGQMLGRSCTGPPAPRAGRCLREEDGKGPVNGGVPQRLKEHFSWN